MSAPFLGLQVTFGTFAASLRAGIGGIELVLSILVRVCETSDQVPDPVLPFEFTKTPKERQNLTSKRLRVSLRVVIACGLRVYGACSQVSQSLTLFAFATHCSKWPHVHQY